MTKVLIIEDEALAAKDLQKLIRQCDSETEILSVLASVEESIGWFSSNPEPDLLFCDIQLSDGVSFDIFTKIDVNCPIIFTTAYNEYALRAFKLNSIDYLLKPVDSEELTRAWAKHLRWQTQKTTALQPDIRAHFADFLKDMQSSSSLSVQSPNHPQNRFKSRFMVHGKGGMLIIPTEEVALFQKEDVIFLITRDGKRHLTDYNTMEDVEEILNPSEFFRANRQTILSINAVEGFKMDFAGKAHIAIKNMPHLSVDVSREKAGIFKKWLG